MSKLRSAEEVWDEAADVYTKKEAVAIIKAHEDAVRQDERDRCLEAIQVEAHKLDPENSDLHRSYITGMRWATRAINAGKVDEKRERLGRALYDATKNDGGALEWDVLSQPLQGRYCDRADAVLAELAKIEGES